MWLNIAQIFSKPTHADVILRSQTPVVKSQKNQNKANTLPCALKLKYDIWQLLRQAHR